jgi:hypothetical protein
MTSRPGQLTCVAIAAAAAFLIAAEPVTRAQAPKGDAEAHLAAYDTHRAMQQSSPYQSQAWSFLGPTNVSGRDW